MLHPRWVLFRTLNYIHIVSALTIAFLQLYFVFNWRHVFDHSFKGYLIISVQMLCYAILIINSLLNLNFIGKYYPAKVPDKAINRLSLVLLILSVIVITAHIVLVFASLEEITDDTFMKNIFMLALFTAAMILIFSGLYIIWNQILLRKALLHNYNAAMDNFLEEEETPT